MPASLETFRASDLEPLATLALEPDASEGKSANFGDRAAVLYEVGGGRRRRACGSAVSRSRGSGSEARAL
jgi:hypothetical protein